MRTVFLALTLLIWGSGSALAAPLDINTHTAAVPEQSLKLAATWFLPDWQASHTSRTDTAPDKSGDRHDLTCSTYGGCGSVPAHMSCKESFAAAGTTCYKTCSCLSGYVRANSSDICRGCVNPCDTVTAVPTPYGCQTPWSVCPSKCQVAYPDNCRNRSAVSTPYGCKTAWSDCSTKCQVAYPDNCHNRTAVATPYGCQTPWSDCSTKCQTAYPDNCRNYSSKPLVSSCDNGCAQGKTLSDCTTRCATGCKASCDTGYHLSSDQLSCQSDGCPSGYEPGKTCGAGYTLETSGQSGTQVCGKCVVKACAVGTTSCAAGLTPVANGHYSGDKPCYECKACSVPDDGLGWETSVTCRNWNVPEYYEVKQSYTDKCGVTYYRCCQMASGCSFDSMPYCNYGFYVTDVYPEETGLSFVPEKITYIPNPSVTITPTPFSGTGEGSCYASNNDYIEDSFTSCGITYTRRCLNLDTYQGWQEMKDYWLSTGDSCSDGYSYGEIIVQDDGCERFFSCCNKKDCRELDTEFMNQYDDFVNKYVNKCPPSYIRNNCEKDEQALVDLATKMAENCYMSGIDYTGMMNNHNIGGTFVCYFYGC